MRTFVNFVIGLIVIGFYPLIGTVLALVFPDKGKSWSWSEFGVGPVITIFLLALLCVAVLATIVIGAAMRNFISRRRNFEATLLGK